MAWTTPHTWENGKPVTAAQMNANLRDNLLHLKVKVDSTELDAALAKVAAVEALDTRESLPMVAVGIAAAAVSCARPVTRRGFFGLKFW